MSYIIRHLGNTDLTSTANTRVFTLNGATSTNKLEFKNSSGTVMLNIAGNGSIWGGNAISQTTIYGESAGLGSTSTQRSNFGFNAGGGNTGSNQSSFGVNAGYLNSGANTSVFGFNSGYQNIGSFQSAFGYYAGYQNSGSSQSTLGYLAGYLNSGLYQSTFGFQSGFSNSGSSQSTFGYNAGYLNTGVNQSAFGYQSGFQNAGNNQSAFGYASGYLNQGVDNSNFGYQAGRYIADGVTSNILSTTSVYLGSGTKSLISGDTNSIVVGYNAISNGSNTTTIGNTSMVTAHVRGAVVCGDTVALATTATLGFLHVPSCAGVPTGVPTLHTGKIPIVVDSTNNKMYIYSGGSWVALN